MGIRSEQLARVGRPGLRLADALFRDVDASLFARLPHGENGAPVPCNHPAFVFGHLSLYPTYMLQKLDIPLESAGIPEGFDALFAAGADCRDDPEGTIYPPKERVQGHFQQAHETLLQALPELDDEALDAPNPNQDLRERLGLQTVGELVHFQLAGHMMFHLGQVSTWRRCMGLPSAM
jgi:hypothetical protein